MRPREIGVMVSSPQTPCRVSALNKYLLSISYRSGIKVEDILAWNPDLNPAVRGTGSEQAIRQVAQWRVALKQS